MSGNNVQGSNSGSFNEDIMYQLYMSQLANASKNNQTAPADSTQAAGGNSQVAFQGKELQNDTFQKSEGHTGSNLLGATVVGGAGAGAAYRFASNPLDAGGKQFSKEFLEKWGKQNEELKVKRLINKATSEAKAPIFTKNNITEKVYDVIKKNIKGETLTAAEQTLLPAAYKDKTAAQTFINSIDEKFKNIDLTDQIAKIKERAHLEGYEYNSQKYKTMTKAESNLIALADDVKADELEKFIKKNADAFNLTGTPEEIAMKAKSLANSTNKDSLYAHLSELKKEPLTRLTAHENAAKGHVGKYSKDIRAFLDDAPLSMKNALKDFKYGKALKWGGLAAAGAFVGKTIYDLCKGSKS